MVAETAARLKLDGAADPERETAAVRHVDEQAGMGVTTGRSPEHASAQAQFHPFVKATEAATP